MILNEALCFLFFTALFCWICIIYFVCIEEYIKRLLIFPVLRQPQDVSSKPTRLQISEALETSNKPDADIDEPDHIPETTVVSRKRKGESESDDQPEKKKAKDSSSSNSSSSSSSSSGSKGTKKVEQTKVVEKTAVAKPDPKSLKGKGRGRSAARLIDTSNVKPHIHPDLYRRSLDEGDMRDRATASSSKGKATSARKAKH